MQPEVRTNQGSYHSQKISLKVPFLTDGGEQRSNPPTPPYSHIALMTMHSVEALIGFA